MSVKSPLGMGMLAGSIGLLGLFASVMSAESTTGISLAPAFTARQLTAPPTDAWLTNGGSLYNQRYSPLRKINRGNVALLKGRWRTHLEGSGLGANFSGQGQPIVYDGVIYISTGASDVFALSADTGRGDSVWLFALDGKIESLPPETGMPTSATPGGRAGGSGGAAAVVQQGVTFPPGAADLTKGAAQYRLLCMACHGESGTGGQNNGVSLATIARTPQALADTAWNGKNNMPSFRGTLTPEQMRDIAYYISGQLLPEHQ
jgi:mono/diheme cytochrome c family protein